MTEGGGKFGGGTEGAFLGLACDEDMRVELDTLRATNGALRDMIVSG